MLPAEIIQYLRLTKNTTYKKLAETIGIEPNVLVNRLRKTKNLGTNQFMEILNVLGYDLVAVPKGENLPKNYYVCDTETKLELVRVKECSFCHTQLTAKELSYRGCPYCFKPYSVETMRARIIPKDIGEIVEEEYIQETKEEENSKATDDVLDLEKLLDL